MALNLDSIADVEANEQAFIELGELGEFVPIPHDEGKARKELFETVSNLIAQRRYKDAHELALRLESGEAEEFGASGIQVPRTLINYWGYEGVVHLFALSSSEAVKCVKAFKDFNWGYWLPEKYRAEVFGSNGIAQVVSNSQSPKVYKEGNGG